MWIECRDLGGAWPRAERGVAIFLLGIKQYKHGYDPVVYETSLCANDKLQKSMAVLIGESNPLTADLLHQSANTSKIVKQLVRR